MYLLYIQEYIHSPKFLCVIEQKKNWKRGEKKIHWSRVQSNLHCPRFQGKTGILLVVWKRLWDTSQVIINFTVLQPGLILLYYHWSCWTTKELPNLELFNISISQWKAAFYLSFSWIPFRCDPRRLMADIFAVIELRIYQQQNGCYYQNLHYPCSTPI